MNDDVPPAWAGALLETMNACFDRLDVLVVLLEKVGDRIDHVADELEEAGATLDRIAAMAGRAQGRGE